MFFGIAQFFVVIGMTALAGRRGAHPRDVPVPETLALAATIALCVIAYGPFLLTYLPARLVSPGFRLF